MKRSLLIITACLLTVFGLKAQSLRTCRYWYDQDFSNAVTTSFNGNNGQLQLNVDALTEGFLHTLHLQVADTSQNWSTPKSFLFMKPENFSLENLSYRCWFDYDIENQQSGSFESGTLLLDVSNLSDGIHTLHFQQVGSTTNFTKNYIFMKFPTVSGEFQYRCWFDEDNSTVLTGQVNDGVFLLDVTALSIGQHELNIQLFNGNLSSPRNFSFYRGPVVMVSANPVEGGTATAQLVDSICTITATANEGYAFENWTENGNIVATEMSFSFIVTEDKNYAAHFMEDSGITQTIQLSPGWNWFSTYLDITLDDLKAALVAALPGTQIAIKSKGDGNLAYNGRRWKGQLSSLDVSQMYMIGVSTSCEITLEGDPIDPAEHSAIISYGANWIGFPLDETMTVKRAFARFPVAGDMVKSKDNGSAKFNGTKWVGTLKNLEPGQGYIYMSKVQGNRILTFPANAK